MNPDAEKILPPAPTVPITTSMDSETDTPVAGLDLPLLKSIETGRNYKIFALLAVILTAGIGIELISVTLLHDYLAIHPRLQSIVTLLSHAFTTAAIIGIVYDLLARRELVESFLVKLDELQQAFTKTVSREAEGIKDSLPLVVINPEHVGRLISDRTAKEILPVVIERVCKSSEVKDAVLQAISAHFDTQGVTWRSLRHALEIQPLTNKAWLWRDPNEYMELHDRMSYNTVLGQSTYTFVCCRKWDDYSRYEFDTAYDSVWLMPRAFAEGKARGVDDLFEVEDFKVNGQIIQGEKVKEGSNVLIYKYLIEHDLVNREVLVSYTVNTVLRRKSHFYRVRATNLTKGMILRADIDGSLATTINALDFFPSDVHAWAARRDNRLWTEVETEDWIFPGQGVAIVWD